MNNEEKIRIEKAVDNIAANIPSLSEERKKQVLENLILMASTKDVIERLAMSLEKILGGSHEYKDIYYKCLNELLIIDENAFENLEVLLKKVQFNKSYNITPGNISISDNHSLIKSTIIEICGKLNELGVDYYLVGALSAFIKTGVELFRYHGDLDFMIAEKDIDKVKEALENSQYIFEDNRLSTNKTYDPKVGITQGEHEVIANHRQNEFHLGFFLFNRQRSGSINIREYYKGKRDGKDIPMVLERHLPQELVELEYTSDYTEYESVSFRTSTPESIYLKKQYTSTPKDLLDIQAINDKIDLEKIEQIKRIRTSTKKMEAEGLIFSR